MSSSRPQILLYASPVSDCSARVRIALRLKCLRFTELSRSHSQSQGEVIDPTLNVAQTVPTLVIKRDAADEEPVVLTQSIAALEYLDKAFPESISLLPVAHDARARADVRRLVQIIAVDTHPLTTYRVSEATQCHFCHGKACPDCGSVITSGIKHTCDIPQAEKSTSAEEVLRVLVRGRDWQKCPRCGNIHELADACNFIQCVTKYYFMGYCYICGEGPMDHHDPVHWEMGSSCPRFGQPTHERVLHDEVLEGLAPGAEEGDDGPVFAESWADPIAVLPHVL